MSVKVVRSIPDLIAALSKPSFRNLPTRLVLLSWIVLPVAFVLLLNKVPTGILVASLLSLDLAGFTYLGWSPNRLDDWDWQYFAKMGAARNAVWLAIPIFIALFAGAMVPIPFEIPPMLPCFSVLIGIPLIGAIEGTIGGLIGGYLATIWPGEPKEKKSD